MMDGTFYDDKGVKVTGAQVSVYDRTYAIGDIISIHIAKEPRGVTGTVVPIFFLVVVIFLGAITTVLSNSVDSSLRPLLTIAVPVLGIVWIGVWLHYSPKNRVFVKFTAGDAEIFSTSNKREATAIVDAVRKAMD